MWQEEPGELNAPNLPKGRGRGRGRGRGTGRGPGRPKKVPDESAEVAAELEVESHSGESKLNAEDSEMSCESGGEAETKKKKQKPKGKAAPKKKPAVGVRRKPSLRRLKSRMGKKRQDPEKTTPAAKKAKTERPVDPEPQLKRKPADKAKKDPVDPAKDKEPKPGETMTGKDEEPIGGGIEPKPSERLESLRAKRARWDPGSQEHRRAG